VNCIIQIIKIARSIAALYWRGLVGQQVFDFRPDIDQLNVFGSVGLGGGRFFFAGAFLSAEESYFLSIIRGTKNGIS
jgi:hypothetical protein